MIGQSALVTSAAHGIGAAHYSAIVLGATGNVGGRIVQLLVKSPMCTQVVVVTRRKTNAFANPKVTEVVVDMDQLEQGVAQHAQGVDVALAAFGVGKGSAKMAEEEVRKPAATRGGLLGHHLLASTDANSNREWANTDQEQVPAKVRFPQRRAAEESSARAGRAEVLLDLCERDHHHHWIDRTLVKSGTCIEALRVV
jgi:NADPH:quinone reductase-like Zn-dependent oxidoreductase